MDVQIGVPPPPPPPPPPPAFLAETPAAPTPPPSSVTQPTTAATTAANVTSPPTQDRIWLHPWTVTEMRDRASQWSLAGDAGVLLYLEQFSDRLTQRADAIQQHLAQTVNAVKSTHTRVLNCLNEFTALANTQFIENRVYDEDETANSTTEASKKEEPSTDKSNVNNTEAQEKVLQRYVEAIQYGLTILDTHFERIEAKLDNHTNGGSSFVEDDEDPGGTQEPILEPKDPYILRPLPFLIGTTEFMQDDYVGLGDLLIPPESEVYDAQQIANIDDDSALSSSDEDDGDENDFQAEVAPAPVIAPAGAPLADLSKPSQSSKAFVFDDDDEDDPFGIGKNVTKIDPVPSKSTVQNDDDFFDDEPKKPPPKTEKAFTLDSDEEENSSFGIPTKLSQPAIKQDKDNDDFDDQSSTTSDKPEEPEPPKPKALSELEKAVLRRRKQMGDPDVPPDDNNDDHDDDDDDVGFGIKPAKTKAKASSNEPSSSTIAKLTSQPLTAPMKTTQASIFGEDEDDDENDIFNPKAKLPNVLPPVPKIDSKSSQKKEKDMFDDDTDDETDIFSPKKKTSTPSSLPATKKNDPIPSQPTVVNKPKPIDLADVSEDDEFFGEKTKSVIPTPATEKKVESSPSDDDDDDKMFTAPVAKPQPPPTTKTSAAIISDDEDPLRGTKPPETKVAPTPVVLPTVKKPQRKLDSSGDDDDGDMFGIPKKSQPLTSTTTATPPPSKVIPPVKSDDDGDDERLFEKSKAPPTINKVLPTNPQKYKMPLDSSDEELFDKTKATPTTTKVLPTNPSKPKLPLDSDEELFPKTSSAKPPSSVASPSAPATANTKSSVSDDPLGIGRSVEPTSPSSAPVVQQTKPSSIATRKSSSSDDEEKSSSSTRVLNPGALPDDGKMDVKKFAASMKLNPNAFKPPGFKPPTRPKTNSITEESPKPSVADDDQPIEKNPSTPTVAQKTSALDSDSDEDDLFSKKKKIETPKTADVEKKEKPTNASESGKSNIQNLSALLNFKPRPPGDQSIPVPKETTSDTSTTSKDEPAVEKTMNDLLRDKAKAAAGRNRAPRTRATRPTRAAAAASAIDDEDDLFATSKSTMTTTTKAPSTPTAAPIIPPPSPMSAPVVPPPSIPVPVETPPSVPAPVTGLPDKSTALAAKQTNLKEKKKFSLFDSDDSDIDELLFGSNTKKTKSSVTTKATTTTTAAKSTSKAPALPLDDDDDFLSKRPVKKTTKPVVDSDDIFADVKSKGQPVNKAKKDWSIMAKSDATDDIFNDASSKSSNASKAKATNGKGKSSKNFDDIF